MGASMKKICVCITSALLISVLFVGWGHDASAMTLDLKSTFDKQANPSVEITPLPLVQDMIDLVSQDRILHDLRGLSGAQPLCNEHACTTLTNRFTGSDDLQWAEDYVYETLVSLHYSVEVLDWSDSGLSDHNILAHKRGDLYPNEEVYFIAHLDGYPSNGLAADDDASGSVALLELARILANIHLKRSVTLFFSTGEEQGSVGSWYFVNHYPDRLGKIKYLVSVEMLGYDSNDDHWMELWSADQNIEFQTLLSDIVTAYPASINLVPQILPGCG